MNDAHVTTDVRDGILTITLARSGKKNALTQVMYTAIADALDRASAGGDVQAEARAMAARLAAKPPASLRLTKELMRKGERELLHRVMKEEAGLFSARLGSPEAKEAFAAFAERRNPDFSRFE